MATKKILIDLDLKGKIDATGTVLGSNLSGTNTGDQDLSGYLLNTTDTFTGTLTVDGGIGVNSTGVFEVRQSGDTKDNGIAITSSNAASHRIWKDVSGNLNIGPSNFSTAFSQDLSGNVTMTGTVAASNLSGTNTGDQDLSTYALLTDITGTNSGTNTGDQDLSGYLLNTSDTLNGTLTVSSANNNIRLLDSNDATVNFSVGVNGNFQIRDVLAVTTPFSITKGALDNALKIKAAGTLQFGVYGAGLLQTDVNGNVGLDTSTYALLTDITGTNSGTNTGDQDLSGYLLNTTDTFTGTLDVFGANNNSKESFLNVKRGSGAGEWLRFQTDSTTANNVSQFVIRRNSDSVDLLSITTSNGATSLNGALTASNLSGTNTGDQDLSGYALTTALSGYLLNTTDTFTGNLNIVGQIIGNNPLILSAGESSSYNTGQTGEILYVNAEGGLQVNSSPDNWATAWAGRKTATINNTLGDSSFPGAVSATGAVTGSNLSGTNTGDQTLAGLNGLTNNASDTLQVDHNNDTSLTIRNNTSGTIASASLDLRASGNNFDLTTYSDLFTGKLNVTEFKSSAGGSSFQFSPASTTIMELTGSAVNINNTLTATSANLGSTITDTTTQAIFSASNVNASKLYIQDYRDAAGSDWTFSGKRIQERIDSTWMGYIQFNGSGNNGGISFGTGTSTTQSSVAERMVLTPTGSLTVTGNITGQNLSGINTGDQDLSTYATELYVDGAISDLVDTAPATLDTLNELAAALGDDPNFATTVTNSIATKLPLAGGTLTGNLSIDIADSGGAPAMTNTLELKGYEGRGVGIKIQDSINSATSPSNREWFVGSGYNQDGFNIGYASDGVQSSYVAQNKFSLNSSGDGTFAGTLGATNLSGTNTGDQDTTYVSSDFTHDDLTGFVANEHIDWTTDQGATNINSNNYTDTNTTYVSSDFTHDDLTGFVANEHIDWTTDQGATNINTGNYTNTTYTAGNGLSLSTTQFRMAGGAIGGSVDLDTYTSSGYYVQGSNSQATSGSNYPGDGNFAGILTVVRAEGNTTHISQTYDQYNSNAFYNRSYYNGTWSSWRNLAQDTNTFRGIDDTPVDAATTTSISSNWAFDNVKTAVPSGAVFTDTNTTYVSSDFTHDDLTGFVANEHIDWTTDQGATNINSNNYTDTNTFRPIDDTPVNGSTTTSISSNWAFDNVKTAVPSGALFTDTDTNTTYVSSDFTHDDLTGFVANEHIDWTTDQGATNINSNNYTDTNTFRAISSTPTNGATTTSISSDWAFDNVKTAVPSGALFTDTDTNTTYVSSDFTHDDLTGFVSNEHIDWTTDQGATNINSNNYTDTNTFRAISSTPTNGATTTSISSDWAFDNVKTAVPSGAVFTDTTYDLSGYLLNTTDTLTGTLTIASAAVPFKFEETGYTGEGKYWRHVQDGGGFRLDSCTTGDGLFTPYVAAIQLSKSGEVKFGGLATAGFMKTDAAGNVSIDTTTYLTSSSTQSKYLRSDANDRTTGNLGVGSIDATSGIGSSRILKVSSTGNSEVNVDHSDGGTGSDIGLFSFSRNGDHLAHMKATHDGSTSSAFLSFHTQTSGGSYANAAANERMRITSSGSVGIGTTSPNLKLDIVSGLNNGIRISATDTTSNWRDISIRSYVSETEANSLGDTGTYIYTSSPSGTSTETPFGFFGATVIQGRDNGNGGLAVRLGNGTGLATRLWIGATGVTVFSNTVTAQNFILSSDSRLKENVEEVDNKSINVDWKTFEMKSNKGQKRYGVIAQELEEVHPEFVRTDEKGMKSVAYIDLLIAKNAELEARLEKLERLLLDK